MPHREVKHLPKIRNIPDKLRNEIKSIFDINEATINALTSTGQK